MGVDDGGQFVLIVKEMTLVDVGEWDCGLLPLTVIRMDNMIKTRRMVIN